MSQVAVAGDHASANRPVLASLRLHLSAQGVSRPPQRPLEERDFLRRAREGLRDTHVGVLNHALIVTWEQWLDRAKRLLLDDAHNPGGRRDRRADRRGRAGQR
ncbi:MAG: hypothetical protein F4121_09110 [Acidimicrobiia bacterium]|nr:hypothetical protein [Acidimicrobiia bacterium]